MNQLLQWRVKKEFWPGASWPPGGNAVVVTALLLPGPISIIPAGMKKCLGDWTSSPSITVLCLSRLEKLFTSFGATDGLSEFFLFLMFWTGLLKLCPRPLLPTVICKIHPSSH